MLRDHLALAKRRILDGAKVIRRQRALIERLDAQGLDTLGPRTLLRHIKDTQALHVADRDRLLKLLRELPDAGT